MGCLKDAPAAYLLALNYASHRFWTDKATSDAIHKRIQAALAENELSHDLILERVAQLQH